MENFIRTLKHKKITLEESFNYSFDILKINKKKFLLPLLVLTGFYVIASIFRIFITSENDMGNFYLLLYTLLSSFVGSIIYAGMRIELTNFIENGQKIDNPINSGGRVIKKVIIFEFIYFIILILLGIIASFFIAVGILIAAVSKGAAVLFISIITLVILMAAIFIFTKLSFFQNIYYVRNLDLVSSFKYSIHIIKGYFMKVLFTKIIFSILFLILSVPIIMVNVFAIPSKNIYFIIIGIVIQAIVYLFIFFFNFITVFIISLFYLNAEYLDLKVAKDNNN